MFKNSLDCKLQNKTFRNFAIVIFSVPMSFLHEDLHPKANSLESFLTISSECKEDGLRSVWVRFSLFSGTFRVPGLLNLFRIS